MLWLGQIECSVQVLFLGWRVFHGNLTFRIWWTNHRHVIRNYCRWFLVFIVCPKPSLLEFPVSLLIYGVISLYLKAQQDFLKKKKDLEAKHQEQLVSIIDILFSLESQWELLFHISPFLQMHIFFKVFAVQNTSF